MDLGVQGYGMRGRMGPLWAGKFYVERSLNADVKLFKDSKIHKIDLFAQIQDCSFTRVLLATCPTNSEFYLYPPLSRSLLAGSGGEDAAAPSQPCTLTPPRGRMENYGRHQALKVNFSSGSRKSSRLCLSFFLLNL